jgi:type VI protein secretion system component Hcp
MKTLVSVFFLLFSPYSCFASCGSNSLTVFPGEVIVPRNARIMIEGYAESTKIIAHINGKNQAWLTSRYSRIRLKVIRSFSGQVNLAQTILSPESIPDPDITYTLVIDSLPDDERLRSCNEQMNNNDSIRFRFSKAYDYTSPVLFSTPVLKEKIDSPRICTPSNYVTFTSPIIESSPYLIIATLRDKTTGKVTIACLVPRSGTVTVGFTGCSGMVSFYDTHRYDISFEYMDICGNRSLGPEAISFTPAPQGKGM